MGRRLVFQEYERKLFKIKRNWQPNPQENSKRLCGNCKRVDTYTFSLYSFNWFRNSSTLKWWCSENVKMSFAFTKMSLVEKVDYKDFRDVGAEVSLKEFRSEKKWATLRQCFFLEPMMTALKSIYYRYLTWALSQPECNSKDIFLEKM